MSTRAISGRMPSLVAGVSEERRGTFWTRESATNMPVFWVIFPSGMMIALTPLVTGTVTVLLCSTARTRDMASCW